MDDVALIRGGTAFVGRRAELARLTELVALAGQGAARAVLVGGDAGVGKTRLTAEAVAHAVEAGAVAAVGRCVDLGAGGLPYLPFTEAFAGLATDPATAEAVRATAADRPTLARLAGRGEAPPGPDDAQQRLALFDAVAAGLRAVAASTPGPLLLVLEDLHWAEASTRDLLRFLLARLSDERLLVVGTYRADDLHRRHPFRAALGELVRLPAVERLELAPFDAAELRDYLTALHGGRVAEPLLRDIGRRSEGNAFYAAELLVALADDVGPAASGRLPDGLWDVVMARVERLPEPVQRLARVAAVAGRRVPDTLLRDVWARLPDADALEETLREAVTHHVLVGDGADRYAFRHALLQEAVYADLLPGERARLHAAYAQALAARPSPATAADLARHSAEANDSAGALAAWLVAAAEAERRLAPAEALAHYEQALAAWPVVPAERHPAGVDVVDVWLSAARAADAAGEQRRALALSQEAVVAADTGGDVAARARARHRLAALLFYADRDVEAMREIEAVHRLVGGQQPSPDRVWAATVEARIMVGRGDVWEIRREHLERGAALVEAALADARALRLAGAEADLLITLAAAEGVTIGAEASERRLGEALRVARAAGDAGVGLRAAFVLALNHLDVGDLAAAEQVVRGALADAEAAGLSSSMYGIEARSLLAQVYVVAGRWDDAVRVVVDDGPPLPAREALFLTLPLLPVLAARDPAAATARAQALVACDPDYPIYWHLVLVPKADALTWLGEPRAAADAVTEALASFRRLGAPLIMGGLISAAVGIAALVDVVATAAGPDREAVVEQARAEGAELLAHARRVGEDGPSRLRSLGPEGRAWLLRAEAEATRLAPGPGGAGDVAAWRAAHGAFGYGHVYELARTAWRLADALLARGGPGDREEASALARAARDTAVRLAARPLREALDALAVRHRLDVGEGRAAPTVLTPREGEVLALVADGLTNREIGARLFISEKTASVHVSRVLAKLGASGRAEAVSLAHRRGLLGVGGAPTVGA